MSFASPWWLVLLVLWPLIPLLDRLAHPKPAASLPLPHLAERGLRRLPYSLPWLSVHGLAFLLLVMAMADPQLPTRNGWQQSPPLFIVAMPQPGDRTVQARLNEVLAANRDRPTGVMAIGPDGPILLSPLSPRPELLQDLPLPQPQRRVSAPLMARGLLAASAKAPKGAWLVILGGQAMPAWRPGLASMRQRQQSVAHLAALPGLALPIAYAAGLTDTDAVTGLGFQLDQVSVDQPLPGPPHRLDQYCLLGALLTMLVGWFWRQDRWQVIGP